MKQGEIWLINLDPTIGAEIKKTRPTIIVNENSIGKLQLKVVAPITDWKDYYEMAPWMIKISPKRTNGFTKTSTVDCFQVRSKSENQIDNKLGMIDIETLEKIKKSLAKVLSIGY